MLVIVDLESTCVQPRDPNFKSEIIEIGAVKFDAKKKEIVDTYQTFVRPKINPILTNFCRELTTITQEQVESAHYFDTEWNRFIKWYGNPENNLFCSWGYYDKGMVENSCKTWNIEPRISQDHWNLKKFYQEITGQSSNGVGLGKAIKQCGLKFEGTQHRALVDAINTVRVLQVILK